MASPAPTVLTTFWHRGVAPQGAVGVDEDRAVAAQAGQHGVGTAARTSCGGVDDFAEGARDGARSVRPVRAGSV